MALRCGIRIGDGACINGRTGFFGSGMVEIGRGSWIGLNNSFYTTRLASISIGANCDIGPDVAFIPGSHAIGSNIRRAGTGKGGDIIIEDGCWIGARVTILGGVRIASGSIVGAGALVNKDVPGNSIYTGVPATLKRTLNDQ